MEEDADAAPACMEEDAESLVLPALQRCVDELAGAKGGAAPSAVLGRLAEHLCPALGVPVAAGGAELAAQLVCRLWNLPLRESLGELTARLSRRLAAELLQLVPTPLPLTADTTQVLVTAARQCVADGELSRALALSERALRELLTRRAAAESQLATFARRADTLRRLAAVEQARFGCLMVRAEAQFLREDWPAADETIREAGGARDASGDQLSYMQRLMFNFGLSRYRQRDWPRAVRWLSSSLEVGQSLSRGHGPAAELRARTLDLLARTHLQAGAASDLRRATQLLQLAFSEQPGLTLRLLVLSCELRRRAAADSQQPADTVEHCVRDAADWCRRPTELLQLADLLQQHQCHQEALQVLRRAAEDGTTADVCRRGVQLLLTLERPQEALHLLTEYCSQTGQPIDGQTVLEQVAALESCASTLIDAGDRQTGTQLLEKLAELPHIEAETAARLLRNVARCRRGDGDVAAAEAALRRSLELQPGSPAAQYLLLQLLLATGQEQPALKLLPSIESAPDRAAVARLWRHLCGFSLGRRMASLYERLLETVVRHLEEPADAVPLIQCLVRCRIESLEGGTTDGADGADGADGTVVVGPLLAALEIALNVIQRCKTGDALDAAGWFSDVAWNVAVHGGEMDPADRSRLFSLSRLFLEFDLRNNQDPEGVSLCRTAAVMAAAAALEASRHEKLTDREKEAHLREVLGCVDECRVLTSRLGTGTAGWADHGDVLLYELEAKIGLSAPDVPGLVSALIQRSETDVTALEAAAALLGRSRPELTSRVLRAAADRLLGSSDADWDRVAALQTRYISLMLDHVDSPGLPADRVLAAVLAVRDSVRLSDGRYPNMTTLYVMTRTWNQAVYMSLQGQRQQANRWAAAARSMTGLLAAQTDWYRQRMRQLPGSDAAPPMEATE